MTDNEPHDLGNAVAAVGAPDAVLPPELLVALRTLHHSLGDGVRLTFDGGLIGRLLGDLPFLGSLLGERGHLRTAEVDIEGFRFLLSARGGLRTAIAPVDDSGVPGPSVPVTPDEWVRRLTDGLRAEAVLQERAATALLGVKWGTNSRERD